MKLFTFFNLKTILFIIGTFICAPVLSSNPSTENSDDEVYEVGFLIHDNTLERWQNELIYFSSKTRELGGKVVCKTAYGDAKMQINQGKTLLKNGIKVLVVVPVDSEALAELVEAAHEVHAVVIAYDKLILNCDLDYYVSFNTVEIGESMAKYALDKKPKGNYVIFNGPKHDYNSKLIRQGQMNILQPFIDNGDIDVVFEQDFKTWGSLESLYTMDEFLSFYSGQLDVVLCANDTYSEGVASALKTYKLDDVLTTGQDGSSIAFQQIITGRQTMSIYKPSKLIATEAAILAEKLSKNQTTAYINTYINNGEKDVPSLLFKTKLIDKNNLNEAFITERRSILLEDQ